MIGQLIGLGLAGCFAAPLIALGNIYDAAKAAERTSRGRTQLAMAVAPVPVRRRPLTGPEVEAARQQYADQVAAEHQRRARIRKTGRVIGLLAAAAFAGTCSMAWPGQTRLWHYVVSGLLAVACLASPLLWRLRARGR